MNLLLLALLPALIAGHGSMIEPPARATMHDFGFPQNPHDSNWMEGFCGGKAHQWSSAIGGKCGICGDAWDVSVKEHEAPGGKYANGIITRNYRPGQEITVTSHITANHLGFVDVRLCRNNDVTKDPDQSCFEEPESSLTFVATGENKLWVTDAMGGNPIIAAQVKLPEWECEQCILQWTYWNGRDWGTCNGACGEVETFRACSDISISANVETNTTEAASTYTSSAQPTTVDTEYPSTTPESVSEGTTHEPASEGTTHEPASEGTTHEPASEGTTHEPASEGTTNEPASEGTTHEPASEGTTHEPATEGTTPEPKSTSTLSPDTICKAIGPWTGNNAMTEWCQNNCNSVDTFCPTSLCRCDN